MDTFHSSQEDTLEDFLPATVTKARQIAREEIAAFLADFMPELIEEVISDEDRYAIANLIGGVTDQPVEPEPEPEPISWRAQETLTHAKERWAEEDRRALCECGNAGRPVVFHWGGCPVREQYNLEGGE